MKWNKISAIIVAVMMVLAGASESIKDAFPEYANVIQAIVVIMIGVANALKPGVEKRKALPKSMPLPPAQ